MAHEARFDEKLEGQFIHLLKRVVYTGTKKLVLPCGGVEQMQTGPLMKKHGIAQLGCIPTKGIVKHLQLRPNPWPEPNKPFPDLVMQHLGAGLL